MQRSSLMKKWQTNVQHTIFQSCCFIHQYIWWKANSLKRQTHSRWYYQSIFMSSPKYEKWFMNHCMGLLLMYLVWAAGKNFTKCLCISNLIPPVYTTRCQRVGWSYYFTFKIITYSNKEMALLATKHTQYW